MSLASFGRDYTKVGAVVASVMSIAVMWYGYALRQKPDSHGSDNKRKGDMIMALGALLLIVSWVTVYMAQKSKGFAEMEGVYGISRLL